MKTTAAQSIEVPGQAGMGAATSEGLSLQFVIRFLRCLSIQRPPKSSLRNQTNLPMFFVIALGLSILCNFTLRQNTAEASRAIGMDVSIEQLQARIRMEPDDYELHSLIAELYARERKFKRAMFHLTESARLMERFGE